MDFNLHNKVIIVTGGAKGIGEGITRVLAEEGATVVITGRNQNDNETLQQQLESGGSKAFSIQAELGDPKQCEHVITKTIEQYGTIHGLVNNAGVNDGVGLQSGSYEKFMQSLHNNVVHYYMMAHYALPHLITTKGAIVNIGSKVAETGQGNTSAYAAANGGRNALTREWAVELLPHSIRVNAVIVAECYTPLYENWINTFPDKEEKLQKITSKIPFEKRFTTATEIANAVAFLLSDKASHITGQLLHVDGGYTHLDRALT